MNKLIKIQEASEYLGCTVNTLYSWVNQRKIPYVKMGRLVRFDMVDLEKWIAENKVKEQKY